MHMRELLLKNPKFPLQLGVLALVSPFPVPGLWLSEVTVQPMLSAPLLCSVSGRSSQLQDCGSALIFVPVL